MKKSQFYIILTHLNLLLSMVAHGWLVPFWLTVAVINITMGLISEWVLKD